MSSLPKLNINLENRYDRVVVLIDMDCFYCQVEELLNPILTGKPIAVVQYNAWRGGGIIAVNYPARAKGVTRHMRGEEAQEHCPEINLVRVPNVREKADLTKYREAGKKVAEILQTYTPLLERASVDEAYLDITEQVKIRLKEMNDGTYKIIPNSLANTFAVGYETIGLFIHEISSNQSDIELPELPEFCDDEANNIETALIQKYNLNLLVGASIVSEIRAKVKDKTGYECSAGIAHNKILAKLACGINKPNKQTILSINETNKLLQNLPIHKIKGLGGKFGEEIVEELQIEKIGELLKFSKTELQKKYDEKNGNWLFLIARGIDLEAVTPRFYSKSIGCCKKFPGKNAITGINTLSHWSQELANEIADRLDKDLIENNRKAKQIVVSFIQEINSQEVSSSRSANLVSYDPDNISKIALDILQKNTSQFFKQGSVKLLNNPIKFLGISVGKFEKICTGQSTLQEMFSKQKKKSENTQLEETRNTSPLGDQNALELQSALNKGEIRFKPSINELLSSKTMENENIVKDMKELLQNRISTVQNEFNVKTNASINSCLVEIESSEDGMMGKPEAMHLNSSSQKLDYKKTYAEYFLIKQPEDYLQCAECGGKILSSDLQTHLDGHLAFKLSQQMREEYRNDLKSQFTESKCVFNKKSNNNHSKGCSAKKKKLVNSPNMNITKYLKACDKPTSSNLKNCIKCEECGCFVEEFKICEHKDLHLAQKLQQEWNEPSN